MRTRHYGLTIAFLCVLTLPSLTSAAGSRPQQLILLVRPEALVTQAVDNGVNHSGPLSEIKRLAPNLAPLVPPSTTRTLQDRQALQRHRLDRYFLIDTTAMKPRQVERLMLRLRQLPAVESVEREPRVDGMRGDSARPVKKTNPKIPDYTPQQNYLQDRQPTDAYAIGGVNAVAAWQVPGGQGQGMRVISSESTHWSYDHIDLPKPYTELNEGAVADYHATASVGVIASQDNGYGTTGIVPQAQIGFLRWGTNGLIQMAERLEAGDVIQVGVQYGYDSLPGADCTSSCKMPMEYSKVVRDTFTYLTEEKGIHVVLAAANGNINLDHPWFEGYFDPQRFDSGAIYAGAVEPQTGRRRYSSQYGHRVNLFSWGANVTSTTHSAANPTTGYTHTYSGTSSANPIIAGAVASLQGVARAKGLGNIPPKQLREYLVATGYPPVNGNRNEIGVQPDLEAAIKKMLDDHADLPPTGRLALPETAQSEQTFNARVYAQSPSQKPLTYAWNATGFTPATGSEETLILQAPSVTVDTVMPITVEVSDGSQSIRLTENITVKAPPISATLFTPEAAEAGDRVPVRVEAHSASGKPLSYAWSSSASLQGSPGNAASGHYIAGPVTSEVSAALYVTVRDGTHSLQTPTAVIKIRPRQQTPRPQPHITGPHAVEAGKPVLLSGIGSVGSNLRFEWSARGFSPATASTMTKTFIAPVTTGRYTVQMAAIDDKNQVEVAEHEIRVTDTAPVNRPPVGTLDADDSVDSGKTMTFTANVSDPDGDVLVYHWQRPDGFTGTIGDSRSITLTAPRVSSDLSVTARAVVMDGRGSSWQGDKPLTVKAAPAQGICDDEAPWSPTRIYKVYGEPVVYNDKLYKQNFYNLNQPPDAHSGATGQPWHPGVACR